MPEADRYSKPAFQEGGICCSRDSLGEGTDPEGFEHLPLKITKTSISGNTRTESGTVDDEKQQADSDFQIDNAFRFLDFKYLDTRKANKSGI